MARLEVTYDGSIDDALDAWIAKEARVHLDSRSYNPAARQRNIQFSYPSVAEADSAARRIRGCLARVLHTYVRE